MQIGVVRLDLVKGGAMKELEWKGKGMPPFDLTEDGIAGWRSGKHLVAEMCRKMVVVFLCWGSRVEKCLRSGKEDGK